MRLGAVADDVTGACDLAGRVAAAGLAATVVIGVPREADLFPGTAAPSGGRDAGHCTVVGLKIRTAPVADAVRESTAAARALLAAGATLLYQKYCSTFDSTADGTIGPVGDALARAAGSAVTVGTPATPAAGRTQYASTVFVHGVPLAESPMRDHPLTPMRDSNVVRLLTPQTPQAVSAVTWETVRAGAPAVTARLRERTGHVLVDALTEDDLDVTAASILALAGQRSVVATGAAGLGTALARAAVSAAGAREDAALPPLDVRGRLIVAGSVSTATRAQAAAFPGERHTLDPLALADGSAELDRVREALRRRADPRIPVLVSAQSDPAQVARAQRDLGTERAAALVEDALAAIALFAVQELHYSHLLVAGGETSGAVVARLGVQRLAVGREAAPGVPWTVGESAGQPVALLLKSGNFGDAGLFSSAWEAAP